MKRLCKHVDIDKLELQYRKLIDEVPQIEQSPRYTLTDQVNDNDQKTFFIQPGHLLVNYDDNLLNTTIRPGIPGPWSASERWIYR